MRSSGHLIKRRTFLGAAATLTLPGLNGMLPTGNKPRRSRKPTHQSFGLRDIPRAGISRNAAESFTLVGLTWAGDKTGTDRPQFLVRTRTERGWTEWFELHDDDHSPDPATNEDRHSRRGTQLRLVRPSDAVQVRLKPGHADRPDDLHVHLVNSGEPSQEITSDALHTPAEESTRSPSQPRIYTRAEWDADESIRGEPEYGDVRGMFVHHTAGTNDYSAADVPGIIRGIYEFHVFGRLWRDIGYNFLVDKYGRLWEGRHGGITKAVIGAHTQGYNSHSFGAAILGDYTTKAPERAARIAYRDLIVWKFALHGVTPGASVAYPDQLTLPAISGHRDAGATECPGQLLYSELPSIRSAALAAFHAPRYRPRNVFDADDYPRPIPMQ